MNARSTINLTVATAVLGTVLGAAAMFDSGDSGEEERPAATVRLADGTVQSREEWLRDRREQSAENDRLREEWRQRLRETPPEDAGPSIPWSAQERHPGTDAGRDGAGARAVRRGPDPHVHVRKREPDGASVPAAQRVSSRGSGSTWWTYDEEQTDAGVLLEYWGNEIMG